MNPVEPKQLSLDDLLTAESEVLRRLGDEQTNNSPTMAGHYSSTNGHSSGGSHSSHTSAKIEKPLSNS
jgi:hypothetical protein